MNTFLGIIQQFHIIRLGPGPIQESQNISADSALLKKFGQILLLNDDTIAKLLCDVKFCQIEGNGRKISSHSAKQ